MRIAIIVLTLLVLTAVLFESGVLTALVMFIIAGSIPSTTLVISPSSMLLIFAAIGWLLLLRIAIYASKQVRPRIRQLQATNATHTSLRRRPTRRHKHAT